MKKWMIVLSMLVLAGTVLAACVPTTVVVTQPPVVQTVPGGATVIVVTAPPQPTPVPVRPNILRINLGPGDVPTLDPNLATDTSSVQVVDELTVGLTRLNEVTLLLEPGMAESWTADATGRVYTFKVRQGIPWVRWNGTEVEQVLDCEGNPRTVTAYDFEYGILRAGNPETASEYAYVLGFSIENFDAYNTGKITDTSKVGVRAIDDATLVVTFTTPAVYNLNIIGLWTAHAVPRWIIEGDDCTEGRGERWTEPGFNQSYGPYALKEWVHDAYLTIVKNPFWPGIESVPVAQIDEIKFTMLDASPAFTEYEAGNLDVAGVPIADIDRVKADPVLSKELMIAPMGCTYYYGFNTTKPPVDNVHMRRALSLAIDRQGLIDTVLKGGQEPAQWFCRPGMAACPTPDKYPDLGVKYDPDKAKAELQSYMADMGFTSVDQIPEITLMYNTSEGHKKIAEAIQDMWLKTLGIKVNVTNQEWKVYLKTIKSPDTPQVWRLGWCLDYPDANNWTREVFALGGSSNPDDDGDGTPDGGIFYKNDTFEQILKDAAVEMDPVKRMDMYAQAENLLVWEDAAVAPIYWYTRVTCTKPYVIRTFSQHGNEALEKWGLQR